MDIKANTLSADARIYDSKGIIPKPGEGQQTYLERASRDLDDLQIFYDDIQKKRADIKSGFRGLEGVLIQGDYEFFDNMSMPKYGFSELFIPNIVVDDEVYQRAFGEEDLHPLFKTGAMSLFVLYGGRYLPLTAIRHGTVKEYLDIQGVDTSQLRDDTNSFELYLKFELPEKSKNMHIYHENIHGVRKILIPHDSDQFEELVALSTQHYEIKYWETYLLMTQDRGKFSWRRPFSSMRSKKDYNYLLNKVKNGVADKFPLPLLVRISFDEFKEIAEQLEAGTEMKKILEEKYSSQSIESWRWQLIDELCVF